MFSEVEVSYVGVKEVKIRQTNHSEYLVIEITSNTGTSQINVHSEPNGTIRIVAPAGEFVAVERKAKDAVQRF